MLTLHKKDNKENRVGILLPLLALLLTFGGAAASFVLVLTAGKQNHSFWLRAIFLAWVLLPFLEMFVIFLISRRWNWAARKTICWLVLFLSAGSLFVYAELQGIWGTRPAAVFLVTPFFTLAALSLIGLGLSSHYGRKND
jgi:hypothetical protein